ncbi:MAG TPA: hypothetical protein VN969_46475 [Streptosporangiaceae bacterium]|nr:hypothetical protein [Streptosporangiaceae bacterium]
MATIPCTPPAQAGQLAGLPPGWRACPRFLVRSAGFPFTLVDTASPELIAMLERRRALLEQIREQRSELIAHVLPSTKSALAHCGAGRPDYKALYRLLRIAATTAQPVAFPPQSPGSLRRWAQRWNNTTGMLAECVAGIDEQAMRTERQVASSMGALAAQPAFREAVFLSSPDAYQHVIARWRWPGALPGEDDGLMRKRERRAVRTVYAYAQRLATKNETTSFFGPVDYGWFLPYPLPRGFPAAMRLRRAPQRHLARRARLTVWATEVISAMLAADPALRRQAPVRVRPGLTVISDAAGVAVRNAVTGRRLRVPAEWARALRFCGRGIPLATACSHAGEDIIGQVTGSGIAQVGWIVPAAVDDPLDWLRARIVDAMAAAPAAGARWLAVLDRLANLVHDFESTASDGRVAALTRLEHEFSLLTGSRPRRGEGTMYADRLLVTEDCRGNAETLDVGAGGTAALTERLAPVLDLCVSYSALIQAAIHERALAVLAEAAPDGRLPYLAFLSAIDRALDVQAVQEEPAIREWLASLDRLVLTHEREGVSRLAGSDLAGLWRTPGEPVVVSPDVFIGSDPCLPGADLRTLPLIVGEIHQGVQIWTHLASLDPELDAVERSVAVLSGDPALAGTVFRRTAGKAFERELPGPAVEFGSMACHPQAEPVRSEALWVTVHEGRIRLVTEDGRQLRLRARHPRSASNWLLGQLPVVAPVPLLSRSAGPRVIIGDVTAWRRRWTLGREDLSCLRRARPAGELVRVADDIRAVAGLPQQVFARTGTARKPVFADLTCPVSLRHLMHYAGQDTALTLTEMLPAPGQWWWRPGSEPLCCEWRMSFSSRPGGPR